MTKKIIFLLIVLFSAIQINAQEWLEWGSNYDQLGFATGYQSTRIASDFTNDGELPYRLNSIEYNSSTMFGSEEPVLGIQWKIVEFDSEPLFDNQIGTLTGRFNMTGLGDPLLIDVDDDTPISGNFAIALQFPDSMYHFFMMDPTGNSDHTWFWKESTGWITPQELMGVSGAWHLRLNVSTVSGIEGDDVENFILEAADFKLTNYPNPFNPTTNISFEVLKNDFISLTIYNNSGQFVENVFEGFVESGEYSFSFDASNLNSGVYYSVLNVGNITQRKKITLVK